MGQPDAPLEPRDTLSVPKKRRFVREYVPTEGGGRELRLYFGLKEISFDEPELIPFGERLVEQDTFLAESATRWSGGEPYAWERVKEMLEALLAEGVVERASPGCPAHASAEHAAFLEQEARRAAPAEPLWWNPDAPAVMERLTGRPLEVGYLEAVVPVHRVAHPAFDAEGRHVGEMNVFPDAMRMKVPTEWRPCPYPGSRFQDDLPMNVTALQAMAKHWRPVLDLGLEVRAEFVRRYPLGPDGAWKLGDLNAFACAALALPTLLLMRAERPVASGALDPVLSSMFRLVDGVRIVTSYLLFLPEQPRTYDTPMTAAELLRLTECENHFLSTRGVCAGPPHMIDEFLATLVDGRAPARGPAPPSPWAGEIAAAVDYGLYGLQLYAATFGLWVRMGLAYERVHEALSGEAAGAEGLVARLRERVEADLHLVAAGRLHLAEQRAWSEARYAELFERAQRGVRGAAPGGAVDFARVLEAPAGVLGERARARLGEAFAARAETSAGRAALARAADAALEYLRAERAALAAIDAVQRKVNALLGRPHPARPLAGDDLALHHRLRVRTFGGLPYLMDAFADELGVAVENTAAATRVTPRGGASFELDAGANVESVGSLSRIT